jgi:DHA2 family multidrug resistance protein-like MFS transporter
MSDVCEPDTAAAPHAEPALLPRRWRLLGILSLSLFCLALDNTKIVVAVPTLARVFGAGPVALKWTVESYLLVYATLLLAGGALSERFGARRMLFLGVSVYAGGSVLAAGAPSVEWLALLRGVMGAGGALMTPASLATLKHVFPERERTRAIALFTASFGAGAALGPVVAGLLLERYSWGAIMLANLPPSVIVVLGTDRWMPRNLPRRDAPLDLPGTVLALLATAALLYAVMEGPYLGLSNPRFVAASLASTVSYVALVAWERRTAHPMLEPALFRSARFVSALLVIVLAYLSFSGVSFVLPQYLQTVRGQGPFEAGLYTVPLAAALLTGTLLAPRAIHRYGDTRALFGSLLLAGAGSVLLAFAAGGKSDVLVCAAEVLFGAGSGSAFANATEWVLGAVPDERAGSAAAVNESAFEFGGVLGVAILGTVQGRSGGAGGASAAMWVAVAALAVALAIAGRAARPR